MPIWWIRQKFNQEGFEAKVAAGVLTTKVLVSGHPTPPRAAEPICTKSEEVGYFDQQNRKVAQVHRYVRPDGTLGASGMPDPKRIIEDDILYLADPDAPLAPDPSS